MKRLPLIDALKAIASQMIVLHHLAFYGPMSDLTHQLAPALVSWFSQHARLAVQVFLVVSGFLTVRALAPHGAWQATRPWSFLGKRYINIAMPYMASLLVAIGCSALARAWMSHSSIPAPPELGQFLAHAFLLHSLLELDSLSAGVWYIAVDFQLFALAVGLLWLGQPRHQPPQSGHLHTTTMGLFFGLGAVSLLWFNRNAGWDNWALYFFGAYALGGLAWWISQQAVRTRGVWAAGVWALVALALVVDFRSRIALAASVALLLGWGHVHGFLYRWPQSTVLAYLGRISYAVFLMNFPVALVVNAAFTRFAPTDAGIQTLGVVVAWMACIAAGAAFYHWVEEPLRRLAQRWMQT
ncbi:MAG: hypothetical protein RLZZ612_1183 [Pseudomonadota bacterium]|jgi:peptidoglycan/LPS O-acetylase OafA/YrhL